MSEAHEGSVEELDEWSRPGGPGLPSPDEWDVLCRAARRNRQGRVVARRGTDEYALAERCARRGWLELTGQPGPDGAMWRATEAGREVGRLMREREVGRLMREREAQLDAEDALREAEEAEVRLGRRMMANREAEEVGCE